MGWLSQLTARFRSGGYDAGGGDRLNREWAPVGGTGENINQLSRDVVRERARDLERNSDNVAAVIDAYERNVVGTGIQLQAKVQKQDGTDDEELNDRIEALWQEWCKFESCDVTGRQTFQEMQTMATRRRLVDGGIFFIMCDDPGAKIPFKLQVKEVDELDSSTSYSSGQKVNKIVAGVELSPNGQPVAYHFKENDVFGWTGKAVRIPYDRVIYLNYRTRPTEIREFSPLAKILVRMRDLNQYMQAVSVKERVLACLAVFIKKVRGTGDFGNQRLAAQRDPSTGYRSKKLTPGMIETLDAGDEIQVVNPSGQASNAREFVMMMLRSIGSALGLSYEATSRDMSQVNYSSARQGMIDDHKTYKIWQKYLIEHFCVPVYERFLTYCVLAGLVSIPGFFEDKARYTKCMFIPNGMAWIDPLKEVRANEYALTSFQTTLEEICASTGKDYREVIKQRAKEIDLIKSYGLKMPPDKGGVDAYGEKPTKD